MDIIANSQIIRDESYTLEVYIDLFNKRIRVDDITGDLTKAIKRAENLAEIEKVEKLIIKARKEFFFLLIENGFHCEAVIEQYFLGSNLYFFCKYYQNERRASNEWLNEDVIVKKVLSLEQSLQSTILPSHYQLRKLTPENASKLAYLYEKVFQIYPTPLNDPHYIVKTMAEGTIYYGFFYNEEIVSAASAEVNFFYKNAELTDCATLPEHRKHGLMKILLEELEKELKLNAVYCAYSIARSLSFGMNAALHQLGYRYSGRLTNNCYIFDKLEDMNVWVKDLSKC